MKIYKINVTQKHIQKGRKSDCGQCPIALAILDTFGDRITNVNVGDNRVINFEEKVLNGDMNYLTCQASKKINSFIDKFDDGKPVKPFNFMLKVG